MSAEVLELDAFDVLAPELAGVAITAGDRVTIHDPVTGQGYSLAVTHVLQGRDRRQLTGRVVAPRRFRGNVVNAVIPA